MTQYLMEARKKIGDWENGYGAREEGEEGVWVRGIYKHIGNY